MAERFSLDHVIDLAKAGETFTLDGATVPLEDLIAIAKAAGTSKATIRLQGIGDRPLEDLVRITVASQGRIILDDEAPITSRPKAPTRRAWFGWGSQAAA